MSEKYKIALLTVLVFLVTAEFLINIAPDHFLYATSDQKMREQADTCYRIDRGDGHAKEWRESSEHNSELIKCWTNFANQGNVQAQETIARIYKEGKITSQNYAVAAQWFLKAATRKYEDHRWQFFNENKSQDWSFRILPSELELGTLFEQGLGVPQDYSQAMKWYKAGEENRAAKCFIGHLFQTGKGVSLDIDEAEKWYKKGGGFAKCKDSVEFFMPPVILHSPEFNPIQKFDKLTYSQGSCRGSCPQYAITVSPDGRVDYEGQYYVKTLGAAAKQISQEKISELIHALNDADFLIMSHFKFNAQCLTDGPSSTITASIDGIEYKIIHYQTLLCDNADNVLSRLENRITAAINVEEWIGTQEERKECRDCWKPHEKVNPKLPQPLHP